MKAVINRYLNNGSKVYACLIDASKAFDLVDHRILFDKLLERGTPKSVVRLLLRWYKSQQLCIRWMGRSSEYFKVTNGVRQGGVLSPILFTLFIIGLVVCVLLPCSTLHLLFVPFLLTVLVPVIRTLLVTTVCMALVIVSLIHLITLLLVI